MLKGLSSEAQKILERDYGNIKNTSIALNAEIPQYPQPPKEKEELVIESIEDIIEHKPSVKKVRDYFSCVIENIAEQESSLWQS